MILSRPSVAARAVILSALAAPTSFAQSVPPGFRAETVLSGGISSPTCMARLPSGRVFIAQQNGEVRVWDPVLGLFETPFHTFDVDTTGAHGLIGLAVDPDFAANGYIYAHISRVEPTIGGSLRRVKISKHTPDISDPSSEVELAYFGDYGSSFNRCGGGIVVGPDKKLYITLGDLSTSANSQLLTNLWGKIVRLNLDGSVPGDNPLEFDGIEGVPQGFNRAIWCVGLRNVFTFDADPLSGRWFLNDVGQGAWEEIDEGRAGANYGWPGTEGPFNTSAFPDYTHPVYWYPHSGAPVFGFAVTGSIFYSTPAHAFPPGYRGSYFFGDHVMGWVRGLDQSSGETFAFGEGFGGVLDFEIDDEGCLLVLRRGSPASLVRVSYDDPLAPFVLSHPAAVEIDPGEQAVLHVDAGGNQPLEYRWHRDGEAIFDGGNLSGTGTPTLTIDASTCADTGRYACLVTNAEGSAMSNAARVGVCLADCECDADLDLFDFLCFQGRFASGDSYADCEDDGDLDFFDFLCYQGKFAGGCQ